LFVLLVYVALVTISGGTVYAVYGWRTNNHSGSNGNVIAAVKEMAQIANKQLDALAGRTSCPTLVAPCPVATCKQRPCIPSSTPPCFTAPPSPMREPCPSGTCRYVLQHLARLLVDHRRPSKCFSTAYWTRKQFWNGSTCTRRSRNHG
jgi:hypothetical protein